MRAERPAVRHVLMTADPLGGVFTYAAELAAGLARRGVRTTLAVMGGALRDCQRDVLARIPGLVVEESSFRVEWMDDPWPDVAAAGRWLRALEARHRPDVVHLNGFAHGALDWRAPVVVVAHSCVLSWWRAVLGEEAPARYGRYRAEVTIGLRSADAVVVPTRAIGDELSALYGYEAGSVIANGVDPASFRVGPKEPFVFAAGRLWDRAKNLAGLAQAAPRLSWPVYVAGEAAPPLVPTAADQAPGALRALGWLDPNTLRGWMARASIYALPARYEPFGLSALEAALSGCALVLGDIPSLREVWGEAATYVDPDDVEALTAAIARLASDDALRRERSLLARARGSCFDAAGVTERYLDLYRALAARGRTRRAGGASTRAGGGGPDGTVHPCE